MSPDVRRVDRTWAWSAAIAAAMVATADATLLQLRRSYFTGGFLVEDAATSVASRVQFFAGAFLFNLAFTLPLALAIGALGRGWIASSWKRLIVMVGVVCVPFALADLVLFEITDFLGDAFDPQLFFDLTGGRLEEWFAVSASRLPRMAAIGCVALAGVAALTWWLRQGAQVETAGAPSPRAAQRSDLAAIGVAVVVCLIAGTLIRQWSPTVDAGLRRTPSGRASAAAIEWVTDVDRDGFGWGGQMGDPAAFDATVHPYALEVPGNGVDEDGLAGDLPAPVRSNEPSGTAPTFVRRPPVVLFVLESVRSDVVSTVYEGRPVTLVLDALAGEGLRHPRAFSHNGYTVQSRYHLLAGSLSESREGTLIDDFASNGYETAYFSGQDEDFGVTGGRFATGFERASVRYDAKVDTDRRVSTFSTPGSLLVPSAVVIERLRAFLKDRDQSRPLFLVVGLGDTHFPYSHPLMEPLLGVSPLPRQRIAPDERDALRATYLQAVAHVDRAVGETLEAVRAATGRSPGAIVLSDHGESLFDEGFLGHGYALNDAQTRVPLVVSGLDLELPDPFGQSDLRDAVRHALSRPDSGRGPRLVSRADTGVFQYLGLVNRPRAIGLLSERGRIAYDLRAGSLRTVEGTVVDRWSLDDEQRDMVSRIAHRWEGIRTAQAASRRPSTR